MEKLLSSKDWNNHKYSIINQIEDIFDERAYDFESEMKAFNLLSARLFANSTNDDHLTISDNKSDQGIDFFVEYNNRLQIFQCKFAEFETIENSDAPLSFNDDGVRDLSNAFDYLFNKNTHKKGNANVSSLKAKINLGSFDSFQFNLVIFGKLTKDAKNNFEDIKTALQKDNINFKLFEWDNIIEELILQTRVPKLIKSNFCINEGQLLTKKDYCYLIANVIDFYKAFDSFGWSIFDLNVRSELHNSPVNSDIVASLTHTKDMKNFHHLNNGVLIFCDNYKLSPKNNPTKIEINNYQIINGCQTVRSIYKAYKQILGDSNKEKVFEENCFVQVKVISKNNNTSSLIDKVIISSNNQNPMNERNLKSNTSEQKKIKSLFDNISKYKWFYQRKDGEFLSLRRLPKVGSFNFRVSSYKGENNSYRSIDNKDLAKSWLSFVGLSYHSIMNSDYFKNERIYDIIFKSKPNDKLTKDFLANKPLELGVNFSKRNDYFTFDERPSAEEYLLSYIIWIFIKGYRMKQRENKTTALQRGVEKNKLKVDHEGKIVSPLEVQNSYLISDSVYMVNNIIDNAKEVFLESFSYVLAQKYGMGSKKAKKLLHSSSFSILCESPKYDSTKIKKDSENILYSIFEFIKFCLVQLYVEIKSDYIAAPRRKTYLANQEFSKNLKDKIDELIDQDLSDYRANWKKNNVEFLDSLPTL